MDIVNVFRAPSALPAIATEAVAYDVTQKGSPRQLPEGWWKRQRLTYLKPDDRNYRVHKKAVGVALADYQ